MEREEKEEDEKKEEMRDSKGKERDFWSKNSGVRQGREK